MSLKLFDFLKLTEKGKRKEEKLYLKTKEKIKKRDHLWLGKFLDKFSKGEKMNALIRTKNQKDDWL